MDEKIRLLIVEDDEALCDKYRKYADKFDYIQVADVTNNSEKALEDLPLFYPHVVILDLELHSGSGSGIHFLQQCATRTPNHRPYIIVVTNNSSATTLEYTRSLGVDFIFSKHEHDFSANKVIDFVDSIKNILLQTQHTMPQDILESQDSKEEKARAFISHELTSLCITPKLKGYSYLVEAILLVANDPSINYHFELSQRYKKSIVSIDRAMQNAISRAWAIGDISDLELHYQARFSPNKNSPTLNEFIFYFADLIASM